jgi:hypothetical protein
MEYGILYSEHINLKWKDSIEVPMDNSFPIMVKIGHFLDQSNDPGIFKV